MRVLPLLLLLAGCPTPDSMKPQERAEEEFRETESTVHGKIAGEFAGILVAGDFEGAAAMLTPELRATESPESLSTAYDQMIAYGGGPADEVQPVTSLVDWPDRRRGDLGWVHVAISGLGFSEAVAVVVTEAGQIRSIEWGRP